MKFRHKWEKDGLKANFCWLCGAKKAHVGYKGHPGCLMTKERFAQGLPHNFEQNVDAFYADYPHECTRCKIRDNSERKIYYGDMYVIKYFIGKNDRRCKENRAIMYYGYGSQRKYIEENKLEIFELRIPCPYTDIEMEVRDILE